MKVLDIRIDQHNTQLLKIEQVGGIACHTGRHSCFLPEDVDGRWEAVEPSLVNLQTCRNDHT